MTPRLVPETGDANRPLPRDGRSSRIGLDRRTPFAAALAVAAPLQPAPLGGGCEGLAMLNRTNRTLSANLNRLNLGTRSLAIQANVNIGASTLRTRHAHRVVKRAGMFGSLPVEYSIPPVDLTDMPGSPSMSPRASCDGRVTGLGCEHVVDAPTPDVTEWPVLRTDRPRTDGETSLLPMSPRRPQGGTQRGRALPENLRRDRIHWPSSNTRS